MTESFHNIDKDLELILNSKSNSILTGGAKKKSKSKAKSKVKSKSKPIKKMSKKTKLKQKKIVVEAGNLIKDTESEKSQSEKSQSEKSKPKFQRQRVVKKNADENTEYISVKAEKPSKVDNTYKPYDIAFLKRLQKSKVENNTTDEEEQ